MKRITKEAMARLDGMLECNVPVYDVVYGPDPHTFSHYRIRHESEWPDYTDMNVLHRMVCELDDAERHIVYQHLSKSIPVILRGDILKANADQITEALLRTAGTWTDEMGKE